MTPLQDLTRDQAATGSSSGSAGSANDAGTAFRERATST